MLSLRRVQIPYIPYQHSRLKKKDWNVPHRFSTFLIFLVYFALLL